MFRDSVVVLPHSDCSLLNPRARARRRNYLRKRNLFRPQSPHAESADDVRRAVVARHGAQRRVGACRRRAAFSALFVPSSSTTKKRRRRRASRSRWAPFFFFPENSTCSAASNATPHTRRPASNAACVGACATRTRTHTSTRVSSSHQDYDGQRGIRHNDKLTRRLFVHSPHTQIYETKTNGRRRCVRALRRRSRSVLRTAAGRTCKPSASPLKKFPRYPRFGGFDESSTGPCRTPPTSGTTSLRVGGGFTTSRVISDQLSTNGRRCGRLEQSAPRREWRRS